MKDNYFKTLYPEDKENNYPQKLYKYLNDRFIKQFNKRINLLDIGCGNLKSFHEFEKYDIDCYGVDKRVFVEDQRIKECDIEKEKIGFEDNFFDVIYSKSVIEHVTNTDNFIKEMKRVLKPNGLFICLTPDWGSQYKHFWDDYTHVKAFTKKSLRDCFLIHGLKNVECEYFYQLPFVWRNKKLEIIPKVVDFLIPDMLKWKDKEQRNTKDRKLIRFSKEKMLLVFGVK